MRVRRGVCRLSCLLVLALASAGPLGTGVPGAAAAEPSVTATVLSLGGGFGNSTAISPSGEVVGGATLPGDVAEHAFAWTRANGITDLGTLGGTDSQAIDVNSHGDVAGYADLDGTTSHAFFWSPESGMVDIGSFGGQASHAIGISEDGMVAGEADGADGQPHPFVWTAASGIIDIASPGFGNAGVEGLSDSDLVVGAFVAPDGAQRVFTWTAATGMQQVPGDYEVALAPNDAGQFLVYGQGGFAEWSPGSGATAMTFPSVADPGIVSMYGLAENGTATGYANDGPELHVVSWSSATGGVDLSGTSSFGFAQAISPSGEYIAGSRWFSATNPQAQYAFGWTAADGFVDLDLRPDVIQGIAYAVNDAGQFVGNEYLTSTTPAVLWELGPPIPATITSTAATSVAMRQPFDFPITASGTPHIAITESGTLPAGVTLTDNHDGTADLAGFPAAATAGAYPLTLTASNGAGSPSVQHFALTVTSAKTAPALSAESTLTETFGAAFSSTATTTGFPVPKLTKTGALPSGVTFVDNGDGTATIAGTPAKTALGVYPLTVTAKNAQGTVSEAVTLTVQRAPTIAKIANVHVLEDTPISVTIKAKGYDTPSIASSASDLFPGLQLADHGDGTGTITGVTGHTIGGPYDITVTASNQFGSSSSTFTIIVDEPPVISTHFGVDFDESVGQPFGVIVATSEGFPKPKVTHIGPLPKGVTFKASTTRLGTWTISGTPKPGTQGVYVVTVTATNALGTDTQDFTIRVT
jgi:probable HAF family extracellular repeat protein